MKNEIITYNDGSLELNVPVSWDEETVWLARAQMAELFDRDVKTIGKHINNALKEESDVLRAVKKDKKVYKKDGVPDMQSRQVILI